LRGDGVNFPAPPVEDGGEKTGERCARRRPGYGTLGRMARRPRPRTLAIDCGGTGLKAALLDPDGTMSTERVRVRTPYPCPPELFVRTLVELVADLPAYDRVSVGMPGMLRHGRVLATPHYVTEAGPFTRRRPDLVTAWSGFHVAEALAAAFIAPTRVVNDAEVQGLAVIHGLGLEVLLTVGTGLGCAVFDDGRLLPHFELSQHPFRSGQTYDEQLGNLARKRVGNARWNKRVLRAIRTLRPVFCFDRLYLGGGNGRHLKAKLPTDVQIVPNTSGLVGGVRLWAHDEVA
jgi:polyphosphate glucokinase